MRATSHAREARAAWLFVLPAIGLITLVTLVPVLWTFWESLHLHDLRMPCSPVSACKTAGQSDAWGQPAQR